MAKTQQAPVIPAPKRVTREGFQKHAGDVVGFHDCETQGEIVGIPRAAKASDSQLDNTKPSVFVIFELLEDCIATEGSADDSSEVKAKKGDMVGVWVKGGMGALRNLCGVHVLMQYTGVKKLKGKPAAFNPMKVYEFDTSPPNAKGTVIPLIEDNRKLSRDVENKWLPAAKGAPPVKTQARERQPGEDEEENYDFPA